MLFVLLVKFRQKPTKEMLKQTNKMLKQAEAWGVKTVAAYWTLGRYDAVRVMEAPNAKALMRTSLLASDVAATETMVAVPREQAVKLVAE
jgi:uncharacterized protein with GYD domain